MTRRCTRGLRAALCCLLILSLALNQIPVSYADSGTVSAPAKDSIYIYTYASVPMMTVYILTPAGETTSAIYRVYAAGVLVGEARADEKGGYCAVPIETAVNKDANGNKITSLGVTREIDGVESSRTYVDYQYNWNNYQDPSFSVKYYKAISSSEALDDSTTNLQDVYYKGSITAGNYYEFTVSLYGCDAIDTVTIPLHYDTSLIEPASVTKAGKLSECQGMETAAEGTLVTVSKLSTGADGNMYGIMEGQNFRSWSYTSGSSTVYGKYSKSSTGGSYTYVNTTTGTIKLEASIDTPTAFSSGTILRFVFRAKESFSLAPYKYLENADNNGTKCPIWFATKDDCPESAAGSPSERVKYYDTAAPMGPWPACGART